MLNEFETKSCGRCGGGGHYSYCESYGTKCFKCAGSGKELTKRGHAAYRWHKARLTIKASEVKLGDYVRIGGVGKFTVACLYHNVRSNGKSLQPDGTWKDHPPHLYIGNADEKLGIFTFDDADVERIGKTREERNAMLMEAFAYQDTLTQAGTVRKR